MSRIGRNDPCGCGSGRKAKKCCLEFYRIPGGEPTTARGSYAGKQLHTHADYGPPTLGFADLVQAVGSYRLDYALSFIRQHSTDLLASKNRLLQVGTKGILMTQAALATVAKAAVLFDGIRGTSVLDEENLSRLLWRYWRLQEPEPMGQSRRDVSSEEIELHLSRMMFAESFWQKEHCYPLSRGLLLFEILPLRQALPDREAILKFVASELGMTVYEFMLVGFSASSYARTRHGLLGKEALAWFIGQVPYFAERIDSRQIARFFSIVSATPSDLAHAVGDWREDERRRPGFGKYAFNPLFKWPIVRLDTSIPLGKFVHDYVEPLEWLTHEAVSHGNYFRLVDRRDGSLGKAFGLVFQAYVGELIRRGMGPKSFELVPEGRYTHEGRSIDSADWVLIEGDEATIIECKTANLRMRGKEGESYEEYVKEMDEVAKAIHQSFRFEEHVRRNPERWPRLSGVRRFHHLVVFYDPQYLANSVMRRAVQSRMGDTPGEWNVIHVSDFEFLFDTLRQNTLAEVLRKKSEDKQHYQMDFHEFIPEAFGYDSGYRHPLLQQVWDEHFDFGSLFKEPVPKP